MKKGTRYLLAFAVCAALFALWIVFQMYVAKGVIVGVIFCSAIFGVWKAITAGGKESTIDKEDSESSTNETTPEKDNTSSE